MAFTPVRETVGMGLGNYYMDLVVFVASGTVHSFSVANGPGVVSTNILTSGGTRGVAPAAIGMSGNYVIASGLTSGDAYRLCIFYT